MSGTVSNCINKIHLFLIVKLSLPTSSHECPLRSVFKASLGYLCGLYSNQAWTAVCMQEHAACLRTIHLVTNLMPIRALDTLVTPHEMCGTTEMCEACWRVSRPEFHVRSRDVSRVTEVWIWAIQFNIKLPLTSQLHMSSRDVIIVCPRPSDWQCDDSSCPQHSGDSVMVIPLCLLLVKNSFATLFFHFFQNCWPARRANYYRFCDMDDKKDVHATVLSKIVVRCVRWWSYYMYVFYLTTLPITKAI